MNVFLTESATPFMYRQYMYVESGVVKIAERALRVNEEGNTSDIKNTINGYTA